MINKEIHYKRIDDQLKSSHIQEKIKVLQQQFTKELCAEHLNAFWKRKTHIISLPQESDFNERNIPTKTRLIQMNQQFLDYCKKEIKEYLNKGLIRPSKSPYSCSAFYVVNASELE